MKCQQEHNLLPCITTWGLSRLRPPDLFFLSLPEIFFCFSFLTLNMSCQCLISSSPKAVQQSRTVYCSIQRHNTQQTNIINTLSSHHRILPADGNVVQWQSVRLAIHRLQVQLLVRTQLWASWSHCFASHQAVQFNTGSYQQPSITLGITLTDSLRLWTGNITQQYTKELLVRWCLTLCMYLSVLPADFYLWCVLVQVIQTNSAVEL